ncbi:MAG TPA: hypothetical protein ENH58_13845 [Maribacter sp.]|nr:hypothetical protein [Maribacter sp.]HEA80387.1 hypothetical protein [Maribacter sp.]
MKTLLNNLIKIFMILLFFSCGGNKEDDIVITPPNEKPDTTLNSAPSIPSLVYPSNELLCIENELDFTWEGSTDPDGDSISYKIQVAFDEQFSDISTERTSTTTETTITLDKGKTFYWRILATDDENNSSIYTPTWTFYTEGDPIVNQLPFTPELIIPKLNEVVSETSTFLTWSTIDSNNDELTYDVYFGLSKSPQLVLENSVNTSYEVGLSKNRIYYWRIVAKDEYGGTSLSPIWNFSTE